jgi:hypothetical protein
MPKSQKKIVPHKTKGEHLQILDLVSMFSIRDNMPGTKWTHGEHQFAVKRNLMWIDYVKRKK